jgi:hypothetical protein
MLTERLKDSPSLNACLQEIFAEYFAKCFAEYFAEYYLNRAQASKTNLSLEIFSLACPYLLRQVFDLEFLP